MNQKPTDGMALIADIAPASSSTTQTSAWVQASFFKAFLALVQVGVFGSSATVDFKVRQAKDSSGTGAKDVTGKAITQILAAAGTDVQAMVNVRAEDLDTTNGFDYIGLSLTVGTAATLVSASLFGVYPAWQPPVDPNASPAVQYGSASVQQIV